MEKLRNDKVARFLGMSYPQMCRLMKIGRLDIGVVGGSDDRGCYYIYRSTLENFLKRKLKKEEIDELI